MIRAVDDLASLVQALSEMPLLLRRRRARLLVIDSIAALFRGELGARDALRERSALLCAVARRLRQLADEHNAAVLVTNQVSAVLGAAHQLDLAPAVRAALGPSWSAGVATRLTLRRAAGGAHVALNAAGDRLQPREANEASALDPTAAVDPAAVRVLGVAFSPSLPAGAELRVAITERGMIAV